MRQLKSRWFIEESPVGSGASAAVHKGYDGENGMRMVAVKLFHGVRSENPVLQESFQRELTILCDLRHENIVEYIDWDEDDARHPFLVLEWVPQDLGRYLDSESIEGWDDFAGVAIAVLKGLAYCHERGHLHRDIKPTIILVTEDGIPKIADFGISRLRDAVNYDGVTFLGGGTEPYRPPATAGDGTTPADPEQPLSHDFSRDVYAWAVLVVEALAGRHLCSRQDVEAALEEIDPPPVVLDLISECLTLDREQRPATAGEVLRRIEAFQSAREDGWRSEIIVPVAIKPHAKNFVATHSAMPLEAAEGFILEDLNGGAVLGTATNSKADASSYRSEDLVASATAYRYYLRQESTDPTRWVVTSAVKLSAASDTHRERGLRDHFVFKRHSLCQTRTREDADALFDRVAEHVQGRVAEEQADQARKLFGNWSKVLYAKKQFEDARGTPVRFRDCRVQGRRVHLEVGRSASEELIGQPRLIRLGEIRTVRGEVEQVTEGSVVLYVESGSLDGLPSSGELLYDTDAAKAALKKQEQALNAVRHGRSVRADLRELVARPSEARPPAPVPDLEFLHDDLDESKRAAVAAAMGLEDIMVVEGPPGTGKTTFIAELVAQYKSSRPNSRILLSSQTHAALDNALERIHRLMPELRLVRLGRAERISDDVEHLRLDAQLESWRDEVLRKSREFLKQKAEEWGVSASQAEVTSLASALKDLSRRMAGIRSQLKRQQDERHVAQQQLDRLNALAPEILESAERLELLLRDSDAGVLEQAARAFIDQGLDLAGALETGGGAATLVAEYDERLKETKSALDETVAQERELRKELAGLLGITDDEPPSTEDLMDASADYAVEDERLTRLEELYAEWERRFGRSLDFGAALLAAADVVAATCVGGAFGATSELEYDLCIIDEVSKATPTEALIPMSRSRRWILVGDRRQLPPFMEAALSDSNARQQYQLTTELLTETLLDRVADALPAEAHFTLSEQHRMAPAIGDLVSHCFYEGRLTSAQRPIPEYVIQALGAPVVWYSTSESPNRFEAQAPGSTSRSNELEAQQVRTLLSSLAFYAQGKPVSIAILTGYAEQRDLLAKYLRASGVALGGVTYEVATVDAFQGREADVCIFSAVRSNDRSELGFLSSRQRINVALSRGRLGLAIVGDAAFIETATVSENPLADVLGYIRSHPDTCIVEEVVE